MTARLTPDEAAKYLDISERTLRKLRQKGEIPYIAISDRIIRFAQEDCDAFLEAKRRTDTPCPNPSRTNVRQIGNTTSRGAASGFMARRERLINERRNAT